MDDDSIEYLSCSIVALEYILVSVRCEMGYPCNDCLILLAFQSCISVFLSVDPLATFCPLTLSHGCQLTVDHILSLPLTTLCQFIIDNALLTVGHGFSVDRWSRFVSWRLTTISSWPLTTCAWLAAELAIGSGGRKGRAGCRFSHFLRRFARYTGIEFLLYRVIYSLWPSLNLPRI